MEGRKETYLTTHSALFDLWLYDHIMLSDKIKDH